MGLPPKERPTAPDLVVDPVGDDDPEPEANPSPDPEARAQFEATLREVLAEPITRMVRLATKAAKDNARKDRFDLWADAWRTKHQRIVAEAMAPTFRLAANVLGRSFDPETFAAELVGIHHREFTSLAKTYPPNELPEALDKLCSSLEYAQPRGFVEALLKPNGSQ
jgi:hypothetical protein